MEQVSSIPWSATRRALKNFVNRRVNDHAAADDIVQEVFLKIHGGIHRLKDPRRINSWIYQITRNVITDFFRARQKSLSSLDQPVVQEDDENDFNACVAGCLQEEMKLLPAMYREVLELSEMGNLSQTELASKLSISYSGAKSRVQRARQMLKDRMDKKYTIRTDHYGNVIECENRSSCDCKD